jgi:hypothetical protein
MARSPNPPRRFDGDDDAPRQADVEALSDATRPCPKCRTTLHDDVALCWKCGYALDTPDEAPGPPKWVIITVLVLLAVFIVPLMLNFI